MREKRGVYLLEEIGHFSGSPSKIEDVNLMLNPIAVGAVDVATHPDANIFQVGEIGFEAWEDRILVIEDPFRSGYECGVCNAKGQVVCDGCNGTGHSVLRADARCSKCNGTGTMTCPECHGKGVLLVIPEQSERRPTTGRIVSVGPKVRELQREQSVLYADYVGHLMDLSYENQEGRKIDCCLRVLRESEILAKISGGHLELRRLRRKVNMNEHGQ